MTKENIKILLNEMEPKILDSIIKNIYTDLTEQKKQDLDFVFEVLFEKIDDLELRLSYEKTCVEEYKEEVAFFEYQLTK
jgi:hypothetical protein